jgi:GNAT superfamily N-acetyltransferase
VEVPRREARRLMITWTTGRIPAGDEFMARVGGTRGLEMRISQLSLDRVDRDMLRRWIEDEPARAEGFEVGFWDGVYPEDRIEAVARLMEVMNTAPRDNLDVEDEKVTPERIREWEAQTEASGTQRWVAYAIAPDGRLAGFTAVGWHPNRSNLLDQWGTGVEPDFRGKGLGRWLKAAMLERAMRERPELRFVRTGNAYSNRWMLAINDALGFEPYTSQIAWQVETERVLEYLGAGR